MNYRKKRFVKRGIIIPIIIAVVITILFFAVYNALVHSVLFKEREFSLADYSYSEIGEADTYISGNSEIRKSELPCVSSNTVIGNAAVNGQAMPVIFDGNEVNSNQSLSLQKDGSMIGEAGCAFLSCNKKDSMAVKMLSEGDIVGIDTYYGSYEYKIVSKKTVNSDIELRKTADEFGRSIAIYTDGCAGIGISDTYYVVVGEMISGAEIME